MKKFITFIALFGVLSFGATQSLMAQEEEEYTGEETENVDEEEYDEDVDTAAYYDDEEEMVEQPLHQAIKTKFIEGGASFMAAVILALILGLALSLERIIYLNLSDIDTDKFFAKFEKKFKEEGVDAAKDLCRSTRGPVASIFYQGLMHLDQGYDTVEKTIESYGSVQQKHLESNLSWIALFIALAPSLGFLGTVIGMIQAFDDIQSAGDMSPQIVAGGIKIALITTVAGLIVAMILQLFYNYCLSKIEGITAKMEDSSVRFMDVLSEKK